MTADRQLLDELFHRLKSVKDEQGIRHISELTLNGQNPRTFYSQVTSAHRQVREMPLSLMQDFCFISNDLVHFTTLLFLLRRYINDPTKEGGSYFQNEHDARYLSYASALHSAVYIFWDRIGDLLHCFFATGVTDNSVYIGRLLNNFPKADKESTYFKELNQVYSDHVRPLADDRNEDVHNRSLATRHFYGIILARGDDQRLKMKEKLRLPDLFKEQIELAYQGFELALRLIEDRAPKL